MSILKQNKHKQRLLMILIIVVGLFIIGMGVLAMGSSNPEPTTLNTLSEEDVNDGTFVALTEFAPLVEFATETIGNTEYTYLIIAVMDAQDNVLLMGLRVSAAEAETIWSYVDENATEVVWIDELPYHGTLIDIPSEATGFYQEGLDWLEVGSDFPVLTVYLEALKGEYVPNTTEPLLVGIMAMGFGLALLILPALFFAGYFDKKVLRQVQAKVMGGDAVQWLNAFETNATNIHGVYLASDALMFPTPRGSQLVYADEVVWAYGKKQDTTMYFVIKIATNYFVVLRTANKKTFMIHFKKKVFADALFEALQTQWPHVVWGYNPDLEKVYKADPAGFTHAVKALEA
jgi:hypothetical protein